MANQNGTRIMGLMVGDGPLRQACEELARTTNAPIHFAGFLNQSKMPAAYAAADVLVLPSDGGETWGLVVNEAMASGKPCLVSDHVGCGPDLIIPGETGDVFPLGDIAALASLLGSYAERRNDLTDMGAKAEQLASKFSVRVGVESLIAAVAVVREGASR
jgi:glycosyltransferase involved in cell wall biosynthesis